MEHPDWLNNEFLTECLQKEEDNENTVVKAFSAAPAAPPGNNYGSVVTRVKVEYQNNLHTDNSTQNVSLIIKSELIEGVIKEMMDSLSTDPVESLFYYQFISEAKKLMPVNFIPKCYFSPRPNTVVLEDLREQGFVMVDRTKPLDFNHCRLYAEASAKLHAVSLAVYKQQPQLILSIGKEKIYFKEGKGTYFFKALTKHGLRCLARETKKLDKYSKYAELIEKVTGNIWDMIVDAHQLTDGINTINQGDPWATNMMFRYDNSGNVSQVKLLDFQALRFGSPINDLVFFIWSSADHDVRKNRLDEFYKIYLEVFNKTLKELLCSEFLTYENITNGAEKLSPFILYIVGSGLPMIGCGTPPNFDQLAHPEGEDEADNPFNKYYTEEWCKNQVPQLLEQLEMVGVFKYLEQFQK